MLIFALIAYYGGSHKYWIDNLITHSTHEYILFKLPAQKWKNRLINSANHFAELINGHDRVPDLILTTDLTDVSDLKAQLKVNAPIALYMHENQLTYPNQKNYTQNEIDHFGARNLQSCLVADKVIFNSHYHKDQFINAFLRITKFSKISQNTVDRLCENFKVIPVGLNLKEIDNARSVYIKSKRQISKPIILWNHRWESDKTPLLFFNLLNHIRHEDFELIITGINKSSFADSILKKLLDSFQHKIRQVGYVDSKVDYYFNLLDATILPVTSDHDNFGISVLEAIYCHTTPILPTKKVYSEHFSNQPQLFYSNFNDLKEKVIKHIRNFDNVKNNQIEDFSFAIRKYDWLRVTSELDSIMLQAKLSIEN